MMDLAGPHFACKGMCWPGETPCFSERNDTMTAHTPHRHKLSKKAYGVLHVTMHAQHFLVCLGFLLLLLLLVSSCSAPTFGGSGQTTYPGWSNAQQNQIALDLAQDVVKYRHQINEKRSVNYGLAYMEVTVPGGSARPFRPQIPYVGMDSPTGPLNDTHSENKLKGWALRELRNVGRLPNGIVVNLLIFTQVRVCDACAGAVGTWASQLQQAAGGTGITVNVYIWQQKRLMPSQPDGYPIRSQRDVVF